MFSPRGYDTAAVGRNLGRSRGEPLGYPLRERPQSVPAAHASVRASRWPAVVTLIAIASLYFSLPERLTPGPSWLLLAVISVLMVPTALSHRTGHDRLNFVLGCAMLAIVTVAVAWSLGTLIHGLFYHTQEPKDLLRSAVALWISNVLVFASWYWRLDAGGPHARDSRASHNEGAFLFPQMTLPSSSKLADARWKPGFIDYLFLAFNTSTAFSPTDVPVLSRWAKLLMMIQSVISLSIVALLAARAINIL